jgi:hypothetical protein
MYLGRSSQPRGDFREVISSLMVFPSWVRHILPLMLLGAKLCDSLKPRTPPDFTRPTRSRPCSLTQCWPYSCVQRTMSALAFGARRLAASDSLCALLSTRIDRYSSLVVEGSSPALRLLIGRTSLSWNICPLHHKSS